MNKGASRREPVRALIVDDERFMRATLRELLEESGYSVSEAASGLGALQMVRQTPPDVILLDIVMPGMDGFETCAELRRLPESKHLPILMVTSLEDAGTINRAYAAGATDYLPKPVNGSLLRHHLRYVLRASRLFEELRQKEERLAVAQRIARLGNWEWDAESGEVHCSAEALRVFGTPSAEASAGLALLLDGVHPEDRRRVENALGEALSGGVSCQLDHRILLPGGDVRHVQTQMEVRIDPLRRSKRLTGTVQDITERKLFEEKLLLAGKVFDHSSEMIMITDAAFAIIDVNPACCQLTGFSRQELIGSDIRVHQLSHHDKHFFRQIMERLDQHGRWQGELWNRRKDGETFPALVAISTVRNEKEAISYYVTVASDISKLRETEQRLQQLTQFDLLTALPNRILFHDRLDQALIQAVRNTGVVGVLSLDIDNFKEINDTLGYHAGDLVLQMVASRVASRVRKSDSVARLGSDEFAVILRELNRNESGALVAQRILDALNKPFALEGKEFYLTASIGLALYPDDAEVGEDLTKKAGIAMSFAKQQGKNCYQFFSAEMNFRANERLLLKTGLRRALERREFLLHYQAKFDCQSGKLTGLEALVRWQHPDRGLVPPLQFIPLAEETGLIVPLGEQVLRLACAQNRDWRQQGFMPTRVAVNLSANQFRDRALVDVVRRVLTETGLPAEALELEITESALMLDTDRALDTLRKFKTMGITIALDDFGTGYSSLSYLKRFPVDTLKIDYSFVKNMFVNAEDAAIVKAIIAMARSLKMKTIAEGVETEDQRVILREQGCDEVQGYVAGMPSPAAEIERFLARS
ncbi:MAG TPA: EAL domain-containing protein [Desulfuromonadales bacterium]|nr:EAL domain-containing protein [Desulfuromonadales bacterium]